ncbi:ATP-dependent protease La domain-containing protein [Biscogniauxia mediterranea]|nr:ATP-dependent protease La domain-containing protein [Biscogniauxia mediterranea]
MSSIRADVTSSELPASTPPDSPVSQPHAEKDDVSVPNPAATERPPAAAAELLLNAVKDVRQIIRLVQCQICSDILQEPTTLPCGHSICKRCIPQTHVRTNISWPATASRLQGFICPIPDCEKEHAVGDCALDVTLNKTLAIVKTTIELERDVTGSAEVSTHIHVQDRWGIAGLSSLEETEAESRVLKGGRIIATYTLAELGKLDYRSEVTYSSVGAGDDVVEAVDIDVFTRLKESVRAEMDCQVCYALFLDPMTTTCGHTFCRSCLQRILDHSHLCPICRRRLSIRAQLDQHSFPSNERLCKIINGFWADLVAVRTQAHRDEERANSEGLDTPLFVCTLAFPSMPLFLHVFEPRYRLMIRRAMEGNRTFGMVLHSMPSARGEPNFKELGTLLRIVNIEFFPDGRSLLETVGVSRFRVTRHGWLDGYIVANIERLDDISVAEEEAIEASETMRGSGVREFTQQPRLLELAEREETAQPRSPPPLSLGDLDTMSTRELVDVGVEFVRRMRAQSAPWLTARTLAIYGNCPTDPVAFPWWLASILPVKDEEKYRLLGTSSVRERLKICCRWIGEWESSRWLAVSSL